MEERTVSRRVGLGIASVVLATLLACTFGSQDRDKALEPNMEKIRIACVGDSITFGAGTENPATDSYPAQLQALLGGAYQVGNFGHNGTTASWGTDKPYGETDEFQLALDFKPKVVVIMLGTNDAHPTRWPSVKGRFESDYVSIIRRFQNLKEKPKVYVGLLPPAPGDPRTPNLAGEVPLAIERVIDQTGAVAIDFHSALVPFPERLPDGLHPDKAGAGILADKAFLELPK